MNLNNLLIEYVKKIIKEDKKNILHLFYYSIIDAILVLSIPLASAIVINSVLAHATLSVVVLGVIVLVLFIFITVLQLIKEYIVEKFQQKVFVKTGIEVATKALGIYDKDTKNKEKHSKLMNYFFDITSIQKFFPILLLDGMGLIVKIFVSLLLLLAFNPLLFGVGLVFFAVYIVVLFLLGHQGAQSALERSDAKHKTIYYLQYINNEKDSKDEILSTFDSYLSTYAKARQKLFKIIIRQLGFTYFAEGFIFSIFLMLGGYLVINGSLPLGEFVASEIIVTSIAYALKGFAKQLDYIYDTIEGIYKVNKLSISLEDNVDE
ncbi:MAG TPA: ABC transporter ATP-binding protein [Epsilonproteobacteria bacterium]|nr:ABC transporter ATP-binding protein [Campylobacterota bacterium]HHD79103.1 ABC transporter ATP-binding protein [Campylobacterota bacterium]